MEEIMFKPNRKFSISSACYTPKLGFPIYFFWSIRGACYTQMHCIHERIQYLFPITGVTWIIFNIYFTRLIKHEDYAQGYSLTNSLK